MPKERFLDLLISLVFGLSIPSLKFLSGFEKSKGGDFRRRWGRSLGKEGSRKRTITGICHSGKKKAGSIAGIERESLLHSELMKIDPASYGERDISIYLPIEEGEGLNEQESAARLAAVTQAYIKVLQSSSFYSEIGKTLPEKIGERIWQS